LVIPGVAKDFFQEGAENMKFRCIHSKLRKKRFFVKNV